MAAGCPTTVRAESKAPSGGSPSQQRLHEDAPLGIPAMLS